MRFSFFEPINIHQISYFLRCNTAFFNLVRTFILQIAMQITTGYSSFSKIYLYFFIFSKCIPIHAFILRFLKAPNMYSFVISCSVILKSRSR